MPEIQLLPNSGKKMETTPAIETLQPKISKQGSSNRDSSLLSQVLGVFPCVPRIRDSSCRTEVWTSAENTLALVSKTGL